MRPKADKEAEKVIKYAESKGFVVVRWARHFVLRRGKRTLVMPKTASCPRALKNARHDVDRIVEEES